MEFLANMPQNIGPIARAAQDLSQPRRRRGVLEEFGDMVPSGSSGQMSAYAPGSRSGGTGGGDGYLAHIARAMHGGRGAEITAQSDGGNTDSAQDRAPRGAGAMSGLLAHIAGLARGPQGADDSKARQLRRLGLGMMAHSGPQGSGITGIGTAGLKAMEANDARAKARRTAESDLLDRVYDHLQTERKFQTGRSDEMFDRRALGDPKEVVGPDGNPRLVRFDKLGNAVPVNNYSPTADLGAPTEVAGPDGKPMLVRFDDYGRAVPVEGYGPKQSETDSEIQELVSRGVPESWAQDVARGNVSIETDDFGRIHAINRATGETRELKGGMVPLEPGAGEEPPNRAGAFSAVEEGTGPIAGLRAATNAVIGPFISGTPFEDTARARAGLRNFAQEAKTALVNNPRFPVAEQEIVAKLMPDPDRFWVDPDAERAKLQELRTFLQNKIVQNRRSLASGRVTADEQGRLADQIQAIERVVGLMGSPDQESSGGGLPTGIPEGSREIGTLNGKPVYQTPGGRKMVAE